MRSSTLWRNMNHVSLSSKSVCVCEYECVFCLSLMPVQSKGCFVPHFEAPDILGTLRHQCISASKLKLFPDNVRSSQRQIDDFFFHFFTDLSSVSEQKKQGLSQLASMLELYLQQEIPDLAQEMTSALPPSCREPLSLIAKVS